MTWSTTGRGNGEYTSLLSDGQGTWDMWHRRLAGLKLYVKRVSSGRRRAIPSPYLRFTGRGGSGDLSLKARELLKRMRRRVHEVRVTGGWT